MDTCKFFFYSVFLIPTNLLMFRNNGVATTKMGHRCGASFLKNSSYFYILTNVLLCIEVVNYGKHDEEDGGRQGDENEPERRCVWRRSGHR
jgi:hypothetical protein